MLRPCCCVWSGEGADHGQGEKLDQIHGMDARQGAQREGPGLGLTQGGGVVGGGRRGCNLRVGRAKGCLASSSHTSFFSTLASRLWMGRWPHPLCPWQHSVTSLLCQSQEVQGSDVLGAELPEEAMASSSSSALSASCC